MGEVRLNSVINGENIATIDGDYVYNFKLFDSISSNITTLGDSNYYKQGSVPFGTNVTDAVNVSQLNALSTSMTSMLGTMQTTINNQAATISTLSSQMGSVFIVGDTKTSAQTADHGKWLLCDGRAISRSTYALLFGLLGVVHGSGDGSTTFNLPNALGRSLLNIGQGATLEGGGTGTNRTVGSKGGSEGHVLTIAEMPAHSHTYTNQTIAADASLSLLGSGNRVTASPTSNTNSVGGGASHSIMSPWIAVGSLFIYTG